MKTNCIHKKYCKSKGYNAIDETTSCKCYNCNECSNFSDLQFCDKTLIMSIAAITGISRKISKKIAEAGYWNDIKPKCTWELENNLTN